MANNGTGARVLLTRKNMVVEAPSTPGRPFFGFSVGNASRKGFPSKWDDAEKWLISGHDSPAHAQQNHHNHGLNKQIGNGLVRPSHQAEILAEKNRITEENVSKAISIFQHYEPTTRDYNGASEQSSDVLKDKFPNEAEPSFPRFKCLEPMKEGFLFGNSLEKSVKDDAAAMVLIHEVKHRDIGTEMTPLGSSTTSRCHTPLVGFSPPRHNTPANRSGPLALTNSGSAIDIAELQECHLAKLQLGTQLDAVALNWSSREEEEEDVSKSLRHCAMKHDCPKIGSDIKTCAWEEQEKSKCCLRYQREEAKIQAWVNLQHAKAEAQSRKLEVKIEKIRSNFEDKLMKRMALVRRKAEELRTAAQLHHNDQIQKTTKTAKMKASCHHGSNLSARLSCGCFPCNNHCS